MHPGALEVYPPLGRHRLRWYLWTTKTPGRREQVTPLPGGVRTTPKTSLTVSALGSRNGHTGCPYSYTELDPVSLGRYSKLYLFVENLTLRTLISEPRRPSVERAVHLLSYSSRTFLYVSVLRTHVNSPDSCNSRT